MSYFKEHARGGRRDFVDASSGRRCPVCGAVKWCQVARDGRVALCKRVASAREKQNRDGVPFWVHWLEPGAAPALAPAPATPSVARADAPALDAAHRAVLARLRLDTAHRAALRARGLDDTRIDAGGYRSLPASGRAALARAVIDAVGEGAATGVPGYRVAAAGGRAWPSFGGACGLLIPVRDAAGRVVALKVRRDEATDGGPRYVYVTSSTHGGASAASVVHVPVGVGPSPVLRVTEGELKADVCSALGALPCVSLPGVGSWRLALPVVEQLAAATVHVAFDADWRSNARVARALDELRAALRAAGRTVRVDTWDPALGKGLDDVLAARLPGRAA